MKTKFYLAYGSNLNIRQMGYRCPGAVPIGTAVIPDYELLYKGSRNCAFLTIEPKDGSKVPVGVWEVSPENERELDLYEGFPTFYYRKEMQVEVRMTDGTVRELPAFVYIMHEDRQMGKPSPGYIRTCEEGYRDFEFDQKYLDEAYEKSTKE